jgi:regulatory protein
MKSTQSKLKGPVLSPGTPIKKIVYSPEAALVKARAYCVYQERSHQELRDKLYEWGLHQKEVEAIISELITTGFINEERFAVIYAGGKFRIKKWGKVKIKMALKEKRVSDYCIRKALAAIDIEDYVKTLRDILVSKSASVKESNPIKKKYKIAQYAVSRGFESDLIWAILGEV